MTILSPFYPQSGYALRRVFHMWKPRPTQPIFTRFHAPLQRVLAMRALTVAASSRPPDPHHRARASGRSLWWEPGRIRGVGSASEMRGPVPPRLPRLELPHALVTPGLVDGHTHLAMWALSRRRVELSGLTTREEAIAPGRGGTAVEGWIVGQGWNANGWDRAPAPPGAGRGAAGAGLPGFARCTRRMGKHRRTGSGWDHPGYARSIRGTHRAGRHGEPTGLLLERAVELMTAALPEPPARALDDALRDAQAEAHRLGVTGIHEVESMAVLDAFRRLDAAGELRLRVLFHPPVGCARRPDRAAALGAERGRNGCGSAE